MTERESDLRRAGQQATRRIEQIIEAAEVAAEQIREDARLEADRYFEEKRREINYLFGSVSQEIKDLSGLLGEEGVLLRQRLRDLTLALEETGARVGMPPRPRVTTEVETPSRVASAGDAPSDVGHEGPRAPVPPLSGAPGSGTVPAPTPSPGAAASAGPGRSGTAAPSSQAVPPTREPDLPKPKPPSSGPLAKPAVDPSRAALLKATQMAVMGKSRSEIENEIRSSYDIDDVDSIINRVLGTS